MKKVYNKLVRDRIPEIIEKNGETSKTRVLNSEEFKTELLNKLIEEVGEVVAAKRDSTELIKELGDILEVIDHIIQAFGLDASEVERVKSERKAARGSFDKKLFLEHTDSPQ